MNWLGDLIAPRLRPTDEVLDLGCGIMQPTGGRLTTVRAHVGVDAFRPYLDRIGPPFIHAPVQDVAAGLPPRSFDVVLLLDVVEHLDKPEALAVLAGAERIARREVIAFTPDGFVPQDGWAAWGMGHNDAQAHRCGLTLEELAGMGYACTRYPNGTEQHGPVVSVLAIKDVSPPPLPYEEAKRAQREARKNRETCLDVIDRWLCLTRP